MEEKGMNLEAICLIAASSVLKAGDFAMERVPREVFIAVFVKVSQAMSALVLQAGGTMDDVAQLLGYKSAEDANATLEDMDMGEMYQLMDTIDEIRSARKFL